MQGKALHKLFQRLTFLWDDFIHPHPLLHTYIYPINNQSSQSYPKSMRRSDEECAISW